MALILYTVAFALLVASTVLYLLRSRWLPYVPHPTDIPIRLPAFLTSGRDYLYSRLPTTFAGDAEAGLSSSTFDLSGNVEDGDARAGLDDAAKAEILRIMKRRRLRFDEARRVYTEARLSAHGIGPDGLPRDPKFVSFS